MRLKKIVNILPDDKFLDYYIMMSEIYLPKQSSYLVLSETSKLKYIKSDNSEIVILKKNPDAFNQILNEISDNSVIIFHSFSLKYKEFIFSIPDSCKKIWLFWGFDGYSAMPKTQFLKKETNRAMYSRNLRGYFQYAASRLKGKVITNHNKEPREIISKMDYCATWVDKDFLLVKKINPNLGRLYFNYYTKELMELENLNNTRLNFENLLLGNSGAPTNNHIEAFNFLSKIGFKGNIYCPLSYGGGEQYLKNVCELGNRLFGNNFKPILNFLPLQEYQNLISSCGIIWMNHIRQQAAGNLLTAFTTQRIVITDKDNPLNSNFDKWDITYYSSDILTDLDRVKEEELRQNKNKILSKLGMESNKEFFLKIKNMI